MNRRSITLWIIIFLVFILLAIQFSGKARKQPIPLTDFFELARQNKIIEAKDRGGTITGTFVDDNQQKLEFVTKYEEHQAPEILKMMVANKVKYSVEHQSIIFQQLLVSLILPIILIAVLWILIMRQLQSGGNRAMSFGKSRARLVREGQVKITFNDVAGVDEAKEELQEVVEFLKDPKKFSRLGGKIPKGVILFGPPGTGKTLLAKAVAGEAKVPFFSISGSDFVEMFVGVGASRVRDLFEQGKRNKPCLIFIDEIDAVGRQRFAGIGGGHDEREQTLNQLLVEMDGFSSNEGVILIAATNRPDVLDPALMRPGRFDRQIVIDFPDVAARERILAVHVRQIKLAKDANLNTLARATPGFSGADLANMVNEAALLAARRNKAYVDQQDLEEAKDRVMMGPERRSLVLHEKEKVNTAYHEVGHALCAKLLPGADPVHKVTVVPRGRSLGATSILPGEDRHNQSRTQLKNYLVYLMGGRAAEEIMMGGEYTTGAANDIHKATELAYKMVCEFGMSDKLGPRTFAEPGGQIFLGKELARDRHYSEATAKIIDDEVRTLIDEAHQKSLQILKGNRELLEKISRVLIERETLSGEELDLLIAGKELPPVPQKPMVTEEEKKKEDKEEGTLKPLKQPKLKLDSPEEATP